MHRLRDLLSKLRISSTNERCYITRIPPELLEHIFDILAGSGSQPTPEETRTLCQLALVNKGFSAFARGALWRWPVLSNPRKISIFCAAIQQDPDVLAKYVVTLDIRPRYLPNSYSLERDFEALEEWYCHADPFAFQAFSLLSLMKRLYLHLPLGPYRRFGSWAAIMKHLPKLRYISLDGLRAGSERCFVKLQAFLSRFTGHLNLVRPEYIPDLAFPPFSQITKLSIEQCDLSMVFAAFNGPGTEDNLSVPHLRSISPYWSGAEHLQVPRWESLQELWLDNLGTNSEMDLRHLGKLSKFTIEGAFGDALARQLTLLPPSLRDLRLIGCYSLDIFGDLARLVTSEPVNLCRISLDAEKFPKSSIMASSNELYDYLMVQQPKRLDDICKQRGIVRIPGSFLEMADQPRRLDG